MCLTALLLPPTYLRILFTPSPPTLYDCHIRSSTTMIYLRSQTKSWSYHHSIPHGCQGQDGLLCTCTSRRHLHAFHKTNVAIGSAYLAHYESEVGVWCFADSITLRTLNLYHAVTSTHSHGFVVGSFISHSWSHLIHHLPVHSLTPSPPRLVQQSNLPSHPLSP